MSKIRFSAYYTLEVNMREIALATQLSNKEILQGIGANIRAKIDFCKTIITNYCDKDFCYLLFACDEEFSSICETIVKEEIIEYIIGVFKVDYLTRRMKNHITDKLIFNTYIKVLSLFDKATDVSVLDKIINFNNTFYIDSFLSFRLMPLKNHWDNLIKLSVDNISIGNTATFLDVIRFLINTMEDTTYKIKVICNGNNYCLYNVTKANEKIRKLAECDNALDLISNLLNNSPSFIDVYLRGGEQSEIVTFLSDIFTSKVKIYMNN